MSTYKDDLDILKAAEKADINKLTFNAITELDNKGLLGRYGGEGESGSGGGLLFVTDNDETLDKTWKEIADAAATSVVIWHEIDGDDDYFHFLGHTFYDNVYYWLGFDIPSSESIYFKAASQTDYPVLHTNWEVIK